MSEPTAEQLAEVDRQRELAATMFPVEWAATFTAPGKSRRTRQARLRKQAVEANALAEMHLAGHSCLDCTGCDERPESEKAQAIDRLRQATQAVHDFCAGGPES